MIASGISQVHVKPSAGRLAPSPAADLQGSSLAFSGIPDLRAHDHHRVTNGNRTGAYPGQLLMLNGLDLAAGGPERSPTSGLLRSGSDSTSEATKLAEQACRVSSPFPGKACCLALSCVSKGYSLFYAHSQRNFFEMHLANSLLSAISRI